jgi:integral membrane protein
MKLFRLASLLEGLSLLIILSVTIGIISREFVFVLGMTHGVLFMLYFVMSLFVSHKRGWSVIAWLLVLLASFVPFGFVGVEMFLRSELRKMSTSS